MDVLGSIFSCLIIIIKLWTCILAYRKGQRRITVQKNSEPRRKETWDNNAKDWLTYDFRWCYVLRPGHFRSKGKALLFEVVEQLAPAHHCCVPSPWTIRYFTLLKQILDMLALACGGDLQL